MLSVLATGALLADPAPLPLTFDVGPIHTGSSVTFGTDPTEPVTRLEITNDWQDRQHGDVADILQARLDVGFLEHFVARADFPYVYTKPEGGPTDTGYGDVRTQLGWRAFDDRDFRMFFGGGVIFDTAAEDATGTGHNQVVGMLAASGSIPEIASRLYETFEYFVSFGGDDDRTEIELSKLDLHLWTQWSDQVWTQTGSTFIVDWNGGEQTGLTFDVEIGTAFGTNAALWIRPGVGVWGHDVPGVYDWSVVGGVRWLF